MTELDPGEFAEQTNEKVGYLMDASATLTRICRDQALQFGRIGKNFRHLAELADEIAQDTAALAAMTATQVEDIIVTEFGLQVTTVEGEEWEEEEAVEDEDEDR